MRMRGFLVIIAVTTAMTWGCSERRSATPTSAPATATPSATGNHEVTITRAEYGESWPFTVDSGVLAGHLTGFRTSGGTELAEVTFTTAGTTYYVNGTAKGTRRYAELDDIWASDTSLPKEVTLKKNMSPIIDRGLKLAQGNDEPFVAPEPMAQPVAVTSGPIRCDQFEVLAAFEPGGAGNNRRARVSIKTDLPDGTNLMVSVGRNFRNSADNEEYSIDYLQEKSTVADWRAGKVVELDQTKWQTKLDEQRATLQRIGEKFNVTGLDSSVTVSFVVPMNQPDQRFGVRNANLVGAAVDSSDDRRVVRRESRLEWPVTVR